ncbi:alpha-L-rhamnosidase C-terminal domain-containing protein [Kutzneria buriramensis]|uniref:alpha-L-rhamnosidase C-terminal domain-containing protein n=1 Tax=Kutzneria buriramensis TaxID=1045776 RepID=UPI0035EEB404
MAAHHRSGTDRRRTELRELVFRPRPSGGVAWAEAAHESPYRQLAIRWELHPSQIEIRTTVAHRRLRPNRVARRRRHEPADRNRNHMAAEGACTYLTRHLPPRSTTAVVERGGNAHATARRHRRHLRPDTNIRDALLQEPVSGCDHGLRLPYQSVPLHGRQ